MQNLYKHKNQPSKYTVVRVTHLLQLLEVFPQELHRPLGLGDAQVDDALFEDLLYVVFLHENLAAFQTFIFFQIGGGGGHLIFYHCCRRKERRRGDEERYSFLSLCLTLANVTLAC